LLAIVTILMHVEEIDDYRHDLDARGGDLNGYRHDLGAREGDRWL
jgi:hypothetical protein